MVCKEVSFQKAIPVWERGKAREMNQMLAFEARCTVSEKAYLRISGHTGYRVFINGAFRHFGPARAGRGYYRVEEIPIDAVGDCTVTVVATGYYCRSFSWLREPSFLCAEIVDGDRVLTYTGDGAWHAYTEPSHLTKTLRFSYQRTFCEAYDFRRASQRLRTEVALERTEEKRFIQREITIPTFEREACRGIVAAGRVIDREQSDTLQSRYFDPSDCVDAFERAELESHAFFEVYRMETVADAEAVCTLPCTLKPDSYVTVAMAGNRTGLIALDVEALEDTDLYVAFDEVLSDQNTIQFFRMGCANVVSYRLSGGERYRLLTAEPYTLGALNLIARGGGVVVHSVGLHRVGFDRREIVKTLNTEKADEVISRIYHAAVETFCQNTFDIYMDCPSRERAGWLCDSFFTSRVEHLLTGKSTVEHAFLSNFAMVDRFEEIPEGMLPMCYPADELRGEFIPNWAMWFVLELQEYAARSNDTAFVEALREKMYALLGYFRKFENADGLLQNLENWVFVEWSKCNELTQDINYPTNMLYYRFKKALAALYKDDALSAEADALRAVIREKSRIGLFFCDNAVRDAQGKMQLSGILTETCQYYAFYMGIATVVEDEKLWETMVEEFGPERKQKNLHPEIHFSNAFIGNYLRLDLLAQAGLHERLEENIRGYFDYMAKKTDTLWENDSDFASCNHGFASHVLVWLDRLGYLNQNGGKK